MQVLNYKWGLFAFCPEFNEEEAKAVDGGEWKKTSELEEYKHGYPRDLEGKPVSPDNWKPFCNIYPTEQTYDEINKVWEQVLAELGTVMKGNR